jgi:hypothetical protein
MDAMTHAMIHLVDHELIADPSGALFDASERMLIVADLHLEKSSSVARRGMLLPPYDTAETLARLAAVVARLKPRLVVALGDSFHDRAAHERLRRADLAALAAIQAGREWVWIAGNHDPDPPQGLAGARLDELALGRLILRHEPARGAAAGEIAGHLHPTARVRGASGAARARCFVTCGARLVMPAFGALAGGLDLDHPAFAPVFSTRPVTAHVLGRDRVWRVPGEKCGR